MIFFFCMSTSLLGFRDFDGLQWLQIVKRHASHANQKGPIRILDSLMKRVPATSGSEAALAVTPAVQALASALQINRVLTHLRLHDNDVGVQGAQAHEIASNTSQWQDGQVWGVSNRQWHVGTIWCRNCQVLASALMVNRVVAADWNQAMLDAVVEFGSCNELTVDHIRHLKTNLQCKTVWCLKRLWLMRCRTILPAQTNYAEVRLGHRRAFRPEVMCSNEGF